MADFLNVNMPLGGDEKMGEEEILSTWERVRWARACLDAREALPSREDVQQWRSEALGGRGVLSTSEAAAWVRDQPTNAQVDEGRVIQIDVILGAMTQTGTLKKLILREGPVTPRRGSHLDRLRELAGEVAAFYDWTPASTAGVILCGTRPAVDGLTVRPLPENPKTGQRWRKIEMSIPIEMPVGIVADQYAKAREAVLAALPSLDRKPFQLKALNATIFALEMNNPDRPVTWDRVFDAWNEDVLQATKPEEWEFKSARNFAFIVRTTYQRLSGRELQWHSPRAKQREE